MEIIVDLVRSQRSAELGISTISKAQKKIFALEIELKRLGEIEKCKPPLFESRSVCTCFLAISTNLLAIWCYDRDFVSWSSRFTLSQVIHANIIHTTTTLQHRNDQISTSFTDHYSSCNLINNIIVHASLYRHLTRYV